MIVTFQGYNGKKNDSVATVAAVAAMTAMTRSAKTLVVQLIDKDIDTVEGMMVNLNNRTTFKTDELEFSDDGIDALLRTVDASKLMKADFDSMCTPVLRAENMLDIATITKNNNFSATIPNKSEQISNLISNAKDVYENIFILCPSNNPEAVKVVNELSCIDKSVYCLTQGHTNKAAIYGKNILYVVTDFETSSFFSLKSVKTMFEKNGKKENVLKISHNIGYRDAVKTGRLLGFVRINRNLEPEDINYRWSEDIKNIISYLLDINYRDYEVSDDWEKQETTELPFLKSMDEKENPDQMSFDMRNYMPDEEEDTEYEDNSNDPTEPLFNNNAEDDLIQKTAEIQIPQPEIKIPEAHKKEEKKKGLFGFGKKKGTEKTKPNRMVENDSLEEDKSGDEAFKTTDSGSAENSSIKTIFEENFEENTDEKKPEVLETAEKADEAGSDPEITKVEEEMAEEAGSAIKEVSHTVNKVWICKSCGTENTRNFCMECGEKKPRSEYWQCPICGTESKGKFCPECGTRRND